MSGPLVPEFIASFESIAGHAHEAANAVEAAEVVGRVLMETGARVVAMAQVPEDVAAAIRALCQERGLELLEEPFDSGSPPLKGDSGGCEPRDGSIPLPNLLDRAQVGITGIAFAIAQTGTLVEVALDDATRLVSSLPRTHIGIVRASEMVPTLLEAAPRMRALLEEHGQNVVLSFLSGPSRTGDIEMILTLGVHGPERAHAILLG